MGIEKVANLGLPGKWPLKRYVVICAMPTPDKTTPELSGPAFGGPPKDWRQRPSHTWLRTVEDDLRPLNFGLATARRRTMDRPAWNLLVDAATSS